jgi:hypothetical protein
MRFIAKKKSAIHGMVTPSAQLGTSRQRKILDNFFVESLFNGEDCVCGFRYPLKFCVSVL